MSSKKLFGVKNITSLIYGIIMLIPMFSILGRVIYVQSNKNAKDSYSGVNGYNIVYKYETNVVNDVSDIKVGNIYYLDIDFDNLPSSTTSLLTCSYVNFDYYDITNELVKYEISCDQKNTTSMFLQFIKATNNFLYVRDSIDNNTYIQMNILNIRNLNFVFISSSNSLAMSWVKQGTYNEIAGVEISNVGTLDNAFEYSISTFTKDNNLGNVDMFGWFTDLFLDSSNPTNNLYIGFVNWYLNYALLVSSGYLMFLVLIWFINFVRRILDKSMYQDYGGF